MSDVCVVPAGVHLDLTTVERWMLGENNLIATGNDSKVYRVGDSAIKLYRDLNWKLLDEYVRALPQANAVVRSHTGARPLTILNKSFEIEFDALDITGCGSLDGYKYTISPYSPYPNLDILSAPKAVFDQYVARYLQSIKPDELGFLIELNSRFRQERPTRLFDEFLYLVDELSRSLDENLSHKGHYIGKYNAKVLPNIASQRITLLITDTAVYIDRVRF